MRVLSNLWSRKVAGVPMRWVLVVTGALLAGPAHSLLSGDDLAVDGLPRPERAVQVQSLDRDAFARRYYRARQDALDPTVRCRRLALYEMGLITDVEPPVRTGYGGVRDRGTLPTSLYLTGTDTIFTRTQASEALRHEYVHAVDDQLSERLQRAERASTTDEHLALRAVIEGTAKMALKSAPLTGSFVGDFDANAWRVVYGLGPRYVARASGGDLRQALDLAPQTIYSLLFSTPPDTLAALPASDDALCQDRLGVLGVLTALAAAGATPEEGSVVARAWAGDRLSYESVDEGVRVHWTVVFTSDHAANLWRERAVAQLRLRHPEIDIQARAIDGASPPEDLAPLLEG